MNLPAPPMTYTRSRILRATLLALIVAALLTVLVVMPAEYGRDPTGFGRITGLIALSRTRGQAAAVNVSVAVPAPSAESATSDVVNAGADGKPPPLSAWFHAHDGLWQSGHFEVPLKGYEELEYKTTLNRGEPLFYRWHVKQGSQVYFEFHGEPSGGKWPAEYFESYEKGESVGGEGSLTAPFTGIHGWYWQNLSDKAVVIDVELVGYYSGFSRQGG